MASLPEFIKPGIIAYNSKSVVSVISLTVTVTKNRNT